MREFTAAQRRGKAPGFLIRTWVEIGSFGVYGLVDSFGDYLETGDAEAYRKTAGGFLFNALLGKVG